MLYHHSFLHRVGAIQVDTFERAPWKAPSSNMQMIPQAEDDAAHRNEDNNVKEYGDE